MFTGLLREFQKSGFRHSSQFVKKSFFGGKGGLIMGGVLLFGSVAKPLITGAAKKSLSGKSPILKSLSGAIGNLLGGKKHTSSKAQNNPLPHQDHLDILEEILALQIVEHTGVLP